MLAGASALISRFKLSKWEPLMVAGDNQARLASAARRPTRAATSPRAARAGRTMAPGARIRGASSSCGSLINVMKASEHRYRDDLSSLSASMRRACSRCAGRPLPQRSMRAPVVEIADIFGQDLLQMALIEDEHVVQALGSDGPHPALGYGIGSRRSEWRANLGNTNIAHPTMECGAVTTVAVM